METRSGVVPAEVYEKLVSKYNDLAKRYRDLRQEHTKCEGYMADAYEKHQRMKDCCKQWQSYVEKHQKKHVNATAEISSSPLKQALEKQTPSRVSSSQTTEEDQELRPPHAQQPTSDDEPVLLSMRSLKRKRDQPLEEPKGSMYIKQEEANSPQNPINIMSEGYSSPEMTRAKLVRTETSDLDACPHRMETPRKRRQDRGVSEEVTRPVPLPVASSSLSEGHMRDEQQLGPLAPNERAESLHNDPAVTMRDFAADQGNSNALRPRSINIPGNSEGSSIRHVANAKRKRTDPRKIAILSEDGEDVDGLVTTPVARTLPADDIKQRLGNLLDEPTPGRQPLSVQRPAVAATPRQRGARTSPKPRFERTPIDTTPYVPYKTPLGLEPPPPDPSPDEEPLRDRPWQSLRLEDFKVNPRFMGTDYAFSETFRGREQRRCLVGCTRPECCGNTLRKAIEMGAAPTTKTDAEVLEAFLGRNYAQIMAAYAPDKRKDVLMQARTQALANQYGKHRQAYDRPRTPPGFWRTDMPSTQEAEQDRARAHEIHLQKVEERWREAMRDGGRWLFRDE